MVFAEEKRITKKGTEVQFRSASSEDAQDMLKYFGRVCGESRFLLREPDELAFTVDSERDLLENYEKSDDSLMLNAYVDGMLIGNGSFSPVSSAGRMKHRATLGIAIFEEYCGRGIGEELMSVLIDRAREAGYEIMELDVYAGNERGIGLYEKMGFERCGLKRKAVKYGDGTYDDVIDMQKFL